MALWGGRFESGPDALFKALNDSLRFDYRLAEQDITGSIGWAKAISKAGVLPAPGTWNADAGPPRSPNRSADEPIPARAGSMTRTSTPGSSASSSNASAPSVKNSTPGAAATTRSSPTSASGPAPPSTTASRNSKKPAAPSSISPSGNSPQPPPSSLAIPTSSVPSLSSSPTGASRTQKCSSATPPA